VISAVTPVNGFMGRLSLAVAASVVDPDAARFRRENRSRPPPGGGALGFDRRPEGW